MGTVLAEINESLALAGIPGSEDFALNLIGTLYTVVSSLCCTIISVIETFHSVDVEHVESKKVPLVPQLLDFDTFQSFHYRLWPLLGSELGSVETFCLASASRLVQMFPPVFLPQFWLIFQPSRDLRTLTDLTVEQKFESLSETMQYYTWIIPFLSSVCQPTVLLALAPCVFVSSLTKPTGRTSHEYEDNNLSLLCMVSSSQLALRSQGKNFNFHFQVAPFLFPCLVSSRCNLPLSFACAKTTPDEEQEEHHYSFKDKEKRPDTSTIKNKKSDSM